MGCACGKGRTAIQVKYEVTFKDGKKKEYPTQLEAKSAAARAGGGTIRPKQKV